jgi:adenylate cyclase
LAKLVVKQGGASRDIPLVKDSFSIGRTPENDIELKDSLISRRHTSIVRKGDRHVLYDLGSSNGTFVNRERVDSKPLENGDVIRVGDTEMTYVDDERKTAPAPLPPPERRAHTDYGSSQQIIQSVDQLAASLSLGTQDVLSMAASLKDIRKEAGRERDKQGGFYKILLEVSKLLSTAPTLDDMLQTAFKLIFEVINAERGVILLMPDGQGELQPRLAYHRKTGFSDGKDLHVSKTITSQVTGEKVSIITSDALQDPRFMQGLSIVQYNIRSALCVPLWEESRVYGAVYVDNLAKSYAFTKEDLELLTAIGNLVALRIRQELTVTKLRREETMRSNLSKFFSPDHVNMLMTRGGDVGLEVTEREVSVAFVDVVSSTTMAEARGPKEIAALLNEFFLMATEAVFAHKGNVNKFIGDEVMAIFNAPLDMPDHAISAVRCCVSLVKEIERHNQAHPGRRFDVRCAVNSGPVVAGNVGTPTRLEYTVLGDTVNSAARISKLPDANRIVVGERTWQLVKGVFKARDLGETQLKGREKTLRVYEIQP